jgi:DNA topoisomerase-1
METKNLSLSTSKVNYIDPRITFYFSKEMDVPIEKLFTKTLIEKYAWAEDF